MTKQERLAELCIRIGMIMEDVCGDAVMILPHDIDELRRMVDRLQVASEQIYALMGEAQALDLEE